MEFIIQNVRANAKIIRFVIAGGTATAADLILLYVFTDFMHIWYVVSVAAAFVIAFLISFFSQKFWTFQDRSTENMHIQGSIYFVIAIVSLAVNTYAVYFLVNFLHFYYMLAQIIVSAFIAVLNYFIYNKFIFKQPT
jgi:putative flippase GtrA